MSNSNFTLEPPFTTDIIITMLDSSAETIKDIGMDSVETKHGLLMFAAACPEQRRVIIHHYVLANMKEYSLHFREERS